MDANYYNPTPRTPEPATPAQNVDLAQVPYESLLKEARSRSEHGRLVLDWKDIPDEVLIREVLARAETAFLVGTFVDNNGNRATKFRMHGDADVVSGKLASAADWVANRARRGWGDAEQWQ